MSNTKRKVSLLVNIVSPARLALYSGLAERFQLQILHGRAESNRESWQDADQALPNVQVIRAWGWQLAIPRKQNGKTFDRRYIHITPGYLHHLLRFRPDAIVSNEMGFRTLMALTYGTLFRKPVWVWWGGTLHTERGAGFARRLLRALISRWARHWISYGQTSTEYLRSLGIPRNHIVEIQNSVDDRLFGVRAAPALNLEPRPVVLCVGQFIMRKGIDLLLQAASAVQAERLAFSLLLVGSGLQKQELEQLANTLALKNVHFLSSQAPEKMPGVYRSADVLIFPTLEDVWGLVANEAMLCGLPMLCSKYAGCAPELFPSENVFDPLNPDEFKAKLRDAIQGRIAQSDCSRLKTTPQLVGELGFALEGSIRRPVHTIPAAVRTESCERQP